MEKQIPIPTDNIFKFYALFGLLIFLASGSGLVYMNSTTNQLAYQDIIELQAEKDIASPTPLDKTKIQLLERRLKVALSDKHFYEGAIGVSVGIAWLLMYYGFKEWPQRIQPVQDDIAKLQLEKLKLEVEQMKIAAADQAAKAHKSGRAMAH